jgi:hypothetical protein
MYANRLSPAMETFVELTRQEPFRTVALFFLGFLASTVSRTVLVVFLAVEVLTKFLYLGSVGTFAVSMAFSLYFVVGFVIWYKHEGLTPSL